MGTKERANTGFQFRPSGCQPGSLRLLQYLTQKFRLGNSGCYNPNSTLSGGGPSWHAYGKAIDLGANWYDPDSRTRGHACWSWLMANREALNLQQVIFGDRIWSVGGSERRYRGGDHNDHIHVAIGYHASQTWTPSTTPEPGQPIKKDEDMVNRFITEDGVNWYYWDGIHRPALVDRISSTLRIDLGIVDRQGNSNQQVAVVPAGTVARLVTEAQSVGL